MSRVALLLQVANGTKQPSVAAVATTTEVFPVALRCGVSRAIAGWMSGMSMIMGCWGFQAA